MTTYTVQHSLQGKSNEAKDRYINSFHLDGPITADHTTLTNISAAVKAFFSSLNVYYSTYANGLGETVKIYNLEDAKPRVPIYSEISETAPFGASSVQQLPEEVAVCLSMAANPSAPLPQARRRGRIYIGPLNINVLGDNVTGQPCRVATVFQDALLAKAVILNNALHAVGGDYTWIILSQTANTFVPIANFTVDNAFDTQRRRGAAPSGHHRVDALTGAAI